MPIYEYSCEKCGNVIERIQKFSDPPLTEHADCGGALTKLISQSSFQLKGDGWYVTDYARKDKDKDSDKDSGTDGDRKDATTTDDKKSDGGKATNTSSKSEKKDKAKASSDTTKKEPSTSKSNKGSPSGGSG
jgi:putative FmdB family regulatory protein